jgi:hypothetical protein|tara:strand:+ start:3058 stop:4095 length:1038 start_codon:yes stop_codon:yes gene_type:complete
MKMKTLLFIASFILTSNFLMAQEFYLNNSSKISTIYKPIQSNWSNININESYEFLDNSGFGKIRSEATDDKEYVIGTFSYENYSFNRTLVFKEKLIVGYIDKVKFIASCIPCLDNELLRKFASNSLMKSMISENMPVHIQEDKVMKESVLNEFYKLCEKDGLYNMTGDVSSGLYDVSKSNYGSDFKILRSCKVELDNNKIYEFTLSKFVALNEGVYVMGQYNLKDIDTYDLAKMIEIFLIDCKLKGLDFPKNTIDAKFESLEENIIGLSYAKNNDQLIKIKVDPKAWGESSNPKRWYLLYHELGHDVLNLEHGNGGKMMFNFIDRGYSWSEFWEDKNYMLNNYLK